MVRWEALVIATVVACSAVENPSVPSPAATLDESSFTCTVEPILVRQCSYNGCHGKAGSALRVYSPGKLRASPPADIDAAIAPLTAAERHANFLSAAGFAFGLDQVDDNWLLRMPLPAESGGYAHTGGAIFTGPSDPQFTAIRAWLSGGGAKCPAL